MLKNIPREDVIAVVKKIGPTIPARIVKELGGDTFLIGAILSDLAEKSMVKVSILKLGGSPFYYLPEQLQKLEQLSQYLNAKDKITFEKLKEHRVLKDSDEDTLTRVSLRNIKDFAKPIDVKIGDKQELFWKFYLVANDEVKAIVKEKFMKKQEEPTKEVFEEKKEIIEEPKTIQATKEEKKEVLKEKIPEKIPEKIIERKKEIEKPKDEPQEEIKPQKKEVQEHFKEKTPEHEERKEEQNFEKLLKYYFENKKIEILEKLQVKKSEVDYIIRVPTPIGFVEYYCKAKDKKKCNEGDIATAYVQGQNRKLPILFLTTGELVKKADDMLHKEFKGVTVNKI